MSQGVQIGKVAKRTGLSIDTIRFYQKIGLVKQPARSEGGFRLFTDADLKDLVFIKKAQELGFSLNEIKQLSILNQEHDHACSQVRDLLEGKLRDVRDKAAQLLQLEAELNKALKKCNRDLRSHQRSTHGACCPVLKALEGGDLPPFASVITGLNLRRRRFCCTWSRLQSASDLAGRKIVEMRVEVLYFEGCPNHAPTVERLRAELVSHGLPKEIEEVEIHNQAEAATLGFLGSPTVRINGLDIEREVRNLRSYGMSCRTYSEGPVRSGLPSSDLICRALDEQTTQAGGGATFKSDDSCLQVDSAASAPAKLGPISMSSAQSGRSGSIALFSGGLAAILASTCCLGPLVLVTLGISGAWIGSLTRLEPYRPLFIVIALVALFFAWRSICQPAQVCETGEVCALPRTRRLYKFLFWASSGLTLLAVVYPYFAKHFY